MRSTISSQIVLHLVVITTVQLFSRARALIDVYAGSGSANQKQNARRTLDPEVNMDATQLITSKGFPCENHYIVTEDGYILNVLRIPHGRHNNTHTDRKPVVILQHGVMGSCTSFLTNGEDASLAYILADSGADVWLGNSRGNSYSYNHTRLNPKDKEFWQFSFDEMAKYDVPAMVNFIVSKTGVDQVYYIGYSQGTTIGFIAFGENMEVASYIKHFIALAPVANVGHTKSTLRLLAPFADEIQDFINLFGHGEINVSPGILKLLAGTLCAKWPSAVCANFLFLLCGFGDKTLNMPRLPVFIAHNPSSTSVRDLLHWAQSVNSKRFQMFDHGSPEGNQKHYNQTTPPLYDPKKVKVPVIIFRGGHDWLSDPEDVSWLLPQLNVKYDYLVDIYAHLDFIWAYDAPSRIYNKILAVIFS